jgi:hypothetical protein
MDNPCIYLLLHGEDIFLGKKKNPVLLYVSLVVAQLSITNRISKQSFNNSNSIPNHAIHSIENHPSSAVDYTMNY